MLVTLYINELPVDTLRKDKIVFVDVVKLWKTLKIREYLSPVPANTELITKTSDKAYTIGNYLTLSDTAAALAAVAPEAYEDPKLGDIMNRALVEVLDRFWSGQPEFTPLTH